MIDIDYVFCMFIMKMVYIVVGSDFNVENYFKVMFLMLVVGIGQLDVINFLLDVGVDINYVRVFFLILFFYVVNQCKCFFRYLMNLKNRLIQIVIFQELVIFKIVFYLVFLSFNERFFFVCQEDNKGKMVFYICCEYICMI